jgi:serine/threonine protein kinase
MGCFGSKPPKEETTAKAPSGGASHDTAPPAKKNTDRVAIGDSGVITDKYILGDELGTGGFSVVKEATSKADGEKYAVKIIEKSVIKEDIKLLKREIEIMKKVDHKNILKLHEIFEDDDKVYIVMELVNGSELFDRIVEKGFYSERNAMNVVSQILNAVSYLHSKVLDLLNCFNLL